MAEIYGWVGKILFVDLTSGTIEIRSTTDYVPKFIGGRALAVKLYWDEVPPECGALDPENRLIFASGPAGGTLGAGSSRTAIVTKSAQLMPHSFIRSTPGGSWAAELKFAGFDALVVRGKAPDPCYIWIHDGEVEIKKADRLWGMTTRETDTELRRLWGDGTRTMLIGPAGENLCNEAAILTDIAHGTGKGAMGAPMGSKNLKAIAVRGTGGVRVARPKDLIDFYDKYVKIGGMYGGPYPASNDAYEILGHGTSAAGESQSIEERFSPTAFWREYYLGWEEVQAGTIKYKNEGCLACQACCTKVYRPVDPTGKEAAPKNLSAGMAAGQCGEPGILKSWEKKIFDGKFLGRPTMLGMASMQEMGISEGGVDPASKFFEFALENGLLTKENTGLDIPTNPDDWPAYFCSQEYLGQNGVFYSYAFKKTPFWKQVAEEGESRFLARMAKENPAVWKPIYDEMQQHAYYSKANLELDEPTEMLWMATAARECPNCPYDHVVSPLKSMKGFVANNEMAIFEAGKKIREKLAPIFGLGPHWIDIQYAEQAAPDLGEPMTWEDKVPGVILLEHWEMEWDSIPYCGWSGFPKFHSMWTPDYVGDPTEGSRLVSAICGIDYAPEPGLEAQREGLKTFEAPWNLQRCINVREGRRREHDQFTDAVYEKVKDWADKETFNKVLDDYYTARGWDVDTGIPTRTKLEELGLKDVADDLEKKYGVKVPA